MESANQSSARTALVRILVIDLAAKFFQRAAFSFLTQEFFVSTRAAVEICGVALFHERATCARRIARCSIFDCIEQTLSRELAIHRLRTRILNRNADAAGSMPQRHRSGDFVYVLTAGTTRRRERFFKIDIANASLPFRSATESLPLLDK